jgi:hypothetical protein
MPHDFDALTHAPPQVATITGHSTCSPGPAGLEHRQGGRHLGRAWKSFPPLRGGGIKRSLALDDTDEAIAVQAGGQPLPATVGGLSKVTMGKRARGAGDRFAARAGDPSAPPNAPLEWVRQGGTDWEEGRYLGVKRAKDGSFAVRSASKVVGRFASAAEAARAFDFASITRYLSAAHHAGDPTGAAAAGSGRSAAGLDGAGAGNPARRRPRVNLQDSWELWEVYFPSRARAGVHREI